MMKQYLQKIFEFEFYKNFRFFEISIYDGIVDVEFRSGITIGPGYFFLNINGDQFSRNFGKDLTPKWIKFKSHSFPETQTSDE